MATATTSGMNASADHSKALDRSHIGSPADGRRLNGSGTQGTGTMSGVAASQNSEVRQVTVKQVDYVALEGSNAPGNFVEKESADFSTDAFKNQAGPRGETNDKLEGVGG